MMKCFAVALLTLALLGGQARAIDTAITIASPADVVSKRASLIANAWGGPSTLPTTLPTVSTVSNPFPTLVFTNVARIDKYVTNAPTLVDTTSRTNYLYVAATGFNGRVIINNWGHQGPPYNCDWSDTSNGGSFAAHYRMPAVVQNLLSSGYSVFAMNMPYCGDAGQHIAFFGNVGVGIGQGAKAMGAFLDSAIQAMNYWDVNGTFIEYDCVGLSGGGWTCTVLPALDPRVRISMPTAGTMPGTQFVAGANISGNNNFGDGPPGAEQNAPNATAFYTIAGYLDIYIMGSSGLTPKGRNRIQMQTLNNGDDCCFGVRWWTTSANGGSNAFDYLSYYSGTPYLTYNQNYAAQVVATETATPGRYTFNQSFDANNHQISPATQVQIMTLLDSNPPGLLLAGHTRGGLW